MSRRGSLCHPDRSIPCLSTVGMQRRCLSRCQQQINQPHVRTASSSVLKAKSGKQLAYRFRSPTLYSYRKTTKSAGIGPRYAVETASKSTGTGRPSLPCVYQTDNGLYSGDLSAACFARLQVQCMGQLLEPNRIETRSLQTLNQCHVPKIDSNNRLTNNNNIGSSNCTGSQVPICTRCTRWTLR